MASASTRRAMINCLKQKTTSKYQWIPSKNRWGYAPSRRFSDKAISEALNIPLEEVSKTRRKQTRWDSTMMLQRIATFIKQHNRWPELRDCRVPENGMPYPESFGHHFRGAAWRAGEGFRDALSEFATHNYKKLPPEIILTIPNMTTRRDVMNKVGIKNLLTKAKKVQQDDFGILWKFPYPDGRDTSMMYVEVINSSPQLDDNGEVIVKDGEPVYDHYFLRVPPNTKTAREAVAWTFERTPGSFVGFAAQS